VSRNHSEHSQEIKMSCMLEIINIKRNFKKRMVMETHTKNFILTLMHISGPPFTHHWHKSICLSIKETDVKCL
jgi:hypothetical protein